MLRILALLLLLPLAAHAEDPGTVTTRATARDRLPNTVADVALGIESRARALPEVQTALAAASARLSAYLRTAGAERTRTQTIQVEPELESNPTRGQPARILGFIGHITIDFRIEAGKLGSIVAEGLGNGATTVESTVLTPRQEELDATRQRLATVATRLALDQARAVAEAAGRRVGAIRSINVDNAGTPPAPRMLMARAAAPSPAAPMATDAGDTEVTASIILVQSLIEP